MATLTLADQFVACLQQSQLVEEERLAAWLRAAGAEGSGGQSPEQLAGRLVQDGLLTDFQARQLLRSRWQGFLLGGKYRILEEIGSGGMGQVLLCEHTRLHVPVAVKVLPPNKSADPVVLERFHREARAALTLSHPHLVRAFDIDEDGAFVFIVMEFVHGRSLLALVQEKGPLPVPFAAACVRQAALGLEYACLHGLVHRDVKPGNILLDRYGTIKILDLGLARFFHDARDQLTREQAGGSILGTADYMAPEQALDSHKATIQSDVYSLGATFYFLLAGQAPFADGSVAQKMLAHQVRQPPPLGTWRDDVPPEVEEVVRRMMAKDPQERYSRPREVFQALEPWSAPLPALGEDELPSFCPAVRRLLAQVAPPGTSPPCSTDALPPLTLAGSACGATGLRGDLTAATRPTSPRPAVSRFGRLRPARLALAAAAGLLLAALVWAVLMISALPWPPAGSGKPPDLARFDPLAGIDPNRVIPDHLAVGQVGQTKTVRLTVRDRERDPAGNVLLYSSLRGENNRKVFTVIIPRPAQAAFKKADIDDPYRFFMSQTCDVTGTIRYLDGGLRLQGIEVTDPRQIKLVRTD
jgi:serine/threonine protein kinase